MFRWTILLALGTLLFSVSAASAQICPLNGTSNNKLVCLIPQVYGPFGLGGGGSEPNDKSVLFTGDHHAAHFESDFLSTFAPINEAVGIQVSQLPLASPSSAISFVYDPALKTFSPSTDESLGPILGDRASTVGRHKLFLGFSYQYFSFNTIDGQNMSNIPTVLQHQVCGPGAPCGPSALIHACDNQSGLTGTAYDGDPCYVRDYIQTSNNIDLRVHQYTIYLTYGLTRHLDFSAAIPFSDVRMTVTSNATIVPNSVTPAGTAPGNVWHSFNPNSSIPSLEAQCPAGATGACLQARFSDSGSAFGIGDVVLRGKYTVHQWERAGVALGVDVRLPSGDETNFLGSGAAGVKPFGIFSYKARVSPHAEVGYEVNGNSTLAGSNIVPAASGSTPSAKGSLPNRFLYIVGADVRVVKRLTGAFDIYGQRLFNAPELVSQPYTDHGSCSGPTDATSSQCGTYTAGTTHLDIAQKNADINISNASLGLKLRAFRNLVLTGNVLLKLDNGGLRAKAVPLVGASYSF